MNIVIPCKPVEAPKAQITVSKDISGDVIFDIIDKAENALIRIGKENDKILNNGIQKYTGRLIFKFLPWVKAPSYSKAYEAVYKDLTSGNNWSNESLEFNLNNAMIREINDFISNVETASLKDAETVITVPSFLKI